LIIRSEDINAAFLQLLHSAGWYSDRQIDTTAWVSALQREGFTSNSLALDVLESLGGLSVRIPPAGINPYEHEIRFDPVRAATGESDRAEEWKEDIGVDLFPIGEEVVSGNVLWIGSDSRVYYGRGFGLYLLGDSLRSSTNWLAFPTSPLVRYAE
jgi:SUKH-3 immunity protein of toxin-antitoxin system